MLRRNISSLELREMSLSFENGKTLFANVSFGFPMNEIVWLRGESGSGKSILAKVLAGLIQPSKGKYLMNGDQVNEMTFEEFLPYRTNIGYSFDFGGLINNRDIISNLLLPIEYHNFEFGSPELLIQKVMSCMQTFNLQKVAYERPSSIIGGLRKAACVARAFIHDPQLLILDDPTTGLRGETRVKLKDLILMKRATGEVRHVIIASEDAEFMKSLHPSVVEIHHGGLRRLDTRWAA